jgi:hypothetical protein
MPACCSGCSSRSSGRGSACGIRSASGLVRDVCVITCIVLGLPANSPAQLWKGNGVYGVEGDRSAQRLAAVVREAKDLINDLVVVESLEDDNQRIPPRRRCLVKPALYRLG